jgi:hypothetical protein
MALHSPLEKLINTIESNVIQTVENYALEYKRDMISKNRSMDKSCVDSKVYDSKSIDRDIYKIISLNGECDAYKEHLDKTAINWLQEYVVNLQQSEERRVFDKNFDSVEFEKKINEGRDKSQTVASVVAGLTTCVGVSYILRNVFNSDYSHTAYMVGAFTGLGATVLESWFNFLGRAFKPPYNESELLGTTHHKLELKQECLHKMYKHLKNTNPKNPLLTYNGTFSVTSKN